MGAATFKIMKDIYVKDPVHRSTLGLKKLEEVIIEAFQGSTVIPVMVCNMARGGMKNTQLAPKSISNSY